MDKEYKCRVCGKTLTLATKNKLNIDYVCTNKDCVNFVSRKKLFFMRLKNLQIKFYDTKIYQKVIFKFVRFFRKDFWKYYLKSLKTKIKYGFWFRDLCNVEHTLIKHAVKILKYAAPNQISWPIDYESSEKWCEDLNTCKITLEEFQLFYDDYWKWCEKYGIDLVSYPLVMVPADKPGLRECVFKNRTAKELAKEKKDIKLETKLVKEYRKWLVWYTEHSAEI